MRRLSRFLLSVLIFACVTHVSASSAPLARGSAPPLDAAAADLLQRKIDRTLEAHQWQDALTLIAEFTRDVRRDPIMFYNAACCHAQLGAKDAAAGALIDAVKAGFRDFDTMESDPDLEPIKDHPTFTAILEARDRVKKGEPITLPASGTTASPDKPNDPSTKSVEVAACPQQDEWKRLHGDKNYRFESDLKRRLFYATCLDEEPHKEMRALIEREADWLSTHLFGDTPNYPTLIAVPTTKDAKTYFDDPQTTGVYEHRLRMLIARDIGESLQHEFVHLMHYGSMERVRQKHPIWIQEGLASLFENFEFQGDEIRFLPNTRHNLARRAVLGNGALSWSKLFALKPEEFMDRAQALYPQVRSIFEYVADRGKLVPFYAALVKTFPKDPTGAKAMEEIFGKPLGDIERQWKEWLKARGAIDDAVRVGDASLGIQIVEVPEGIRIRDTLPKSAVRAAGLKIGDVIVAIDGKPVRSSRELALVVAAKNVGDVVTVRYRRAEIYTEVAVTLRPLANQLPAR